MINRLRVPNFIELLLVSNLILYTYYNFFIFFRDQLVPFYLSIHIQSWPSKSEQ
jgi:hypothetical protein